jgi:hypothetical protein
MRLLIPGEGVHRLVDRTTTEATPAHGPVGGLTPVARALAHRNTQLRATLHPFDLELGMLIDLRVGDVLRTDHGLDTPLHVNAVDGDERVGEPFCRGFLGKSGLSRAVELTTVRVQADVEPDGARGPIQ